MITIKDIPQVLRQRKIYHCTKGSDKRPLRAKVNGRPQFWKRQPNKFRLPMKHGLSNTFQLTPLNAHEWFLSESEAARQKP